MKSKKPLTGLIGAIAETNPIITLERYQSLVGA